MSEPMHRVDWVVCHGFERAVADGRVECPAETAGAQSREVDIQDCLECRHLTVTPVDRERQGMCSAGP